MQSLMTQVIQAFGYPGLFAIIFAESGLFFGFFLPGDSLLVTAGLLATQGYFKIEYLLILIGFAAVSGDSVGYWFGKKFGPRIFKKDNSLLFNKDHIKRAQDFYEKHGGKTIIFARFLPIVRTFAPIVAGIGGMNYKKFLSFNIIGGIGWTSLMLLFGYFLGNTIPNVEKYMIPLIILIVIASFIPGAIENRRNIKRQLQKAWAKVSSK
jgi:membrane-associated protein